jgi:hypothetical protein
MLKLPIWAVVEHIQTVIEPLPCSEPGKTAVFSSSEKLFAFMKAHLHGEWKMAMAADQKGLAVMIADFHRAEIKTLIIDPKLDGSGGHSISLAEFITSTDELG